MSVEALAGLESQITLKFHEFETAVSEENENTLKLADELVVLIEERNTKCKVLK